MKAIQFKKHELNLIKRALRHFDISGEIESTYKVTDKQADTARKIITKLLDDDEYYYYETHD